MRIVKNLEKTKIQSKETKGYLDETKDSLAEELLESLLQHVGDPQVIESILTMCIDMLGSYDRSKPIFRKGGKLIRK